MKKLVVFVVMFAAAISLSAVSFAGQGKGCCKQNFGPKNGKQCAMGEKACCAMKDGKHDASCKMGEKMGDKMADKMSDSAHGAGEAVASATTNTVEATKGAVETTANATGSAVANVVDAVTPDAPKS